MPLQIFKRGKYYYVYGKIEYNGRPITGTYRRSTKASTKEGARDWVALETEMQIRRHVVGDEISKTFSDAIMLYNASEEDAERLIPIVKEIGAMPLADITGASDPRKAL
jgi:hypothetical protein